MGRSVTVGDFEVTVEVGESGDPIKPGYVVRYVITRTDGRPVRDDLLQVHSYDLIDGTEYFATIDSALNYGEQKARDDIARL